MPTKQRNETEVSVNGQVIDETTLRLVLEARARNRGVQITAAEGAMDGHLYHSTVDGSTVTVQIRRNYMRSEVARTDLHQAQVERGQLVRQRASVAQSAETPELSERLIQIDGLIDDLEQRMADLESTVASMTVESHSFPLTGGMDCLLSQ
ncbi:MAG: hypothetical protein JSS66_00145 [Armatimonadetes bacterium]|nr:hypothetical protein [Armatimonadota bacterium]